MQQKLLWPLILQYWKDKDISCTVIKMGISQKVVKLDWRKRKNKINSERSQSYPKFGNDQNPNRVSVVKLMRVITEVR